MDCFKHLIHSSLSSSAAADILYTVCLPSTTCKLLKNANLETFVHRHNHRVINNKRVGWNSVNCVGQVVFFRPIERLWIDCETCKNRATSCRLSLSTKDEEKMNSWTPNMKSIRLFVYWADKCWFIWRRIFRKNIFWDDRLEHLRIYAEFSKVFFFSCPELCSRKVNIRHSPFLPSLFYML